MGDAQQARNLYRKALDLKPNEPSVLSNLGMSYVLEGDLKTAETYMRSASEQPGADSRVRQNLALVVGLQGRFDEAEQIASQELSPEQAQANVAYLRSMLSQQNAWKQLKDERQEERDQHQLARPIPICRYRRSAKARVVVDRPQPCALMRRRQRRLASLTQSDRRDCRSPIVYFWPSGCRRCRAR